MMSLWGDGWFYISAGGFIVSTVLFVFLLGQYRAAVEAEDEAEPAAEPSAEPVPIVPLGSPEKVYTPKAILDAMKTGPAPEPAPALKPAAATAASAPAPAPAAQAQPVPAAEKTIPPGVKKENTTGGISPAVVYLQNLKLQMERLDKDMAGLKAQAAQQASQNDLILKKLAELGDKLAQAPVAEAPAAAPAPVPQADAEMPGVRTIDLDIQPERAEPAPAPAPKRRKADKAAAPAPAPAPVIIEPAPEPASAPIEAAPEPAPVVEAAPEAAPVAAAEPAPAVVPVVEAAPEPQPVVASVPAEADAEKTMVIEPTQKPIKLGGADIPPPPRPGFELKPPASAETPQEAPKPARKGPVWPI